MEKEIGKLTDWTEKERQVDLAWIEENMPIFKEVALAEFDEQGPGIIVVHTFEHQEDGGHPFGYLAQAVVDEFGKEEISQLVCEYDPRNEIVVTLLKAGNQSTYRVPFSLADDA